MIEQPPILRTVRLGFHIGGARIIDDVSLEVRAGEFMTIIGPNGAGKTSLFNLLSGLYRVSSGRIELAGRDITRDPPFRRARAGLGRTFQTSSIFPARSVLENARLAAQARAGDSLRIWRRAAALRARSPTAINGNSNSPSCSALSPASCCSTSRRPV